MMTPHISPGPVKWIAGFVVVLVLFVCGSGRVLAQTSFEENVILVKLTQTAANQLDIRIVNNIVETGLPSLDALNQQYGARVMNRVLRNAGKFEARHAQFGLTRYYRLQFDAGSDVDALTQAYSADGNLESAQPNWRYELFGDRKKSPRVNFTPNDPSYPNQWHYNNTGQNGGTPDADIDLPEAWDIETGDPSVIVSDLDSGLDLDHPDLAANAWVNPGEIPGNGLDDDNNGYIDDVNGWDFSSNNNNPNPEPTDPDRDHGTHTAGTVAAVTNNGTGVAGVAFNSRVMPCQIFPNAFDNVIANAFTYAADNGSIVSTNSWGGGGQSNLIEDAIDYFLATTDGVVVFAAGNSNSSNPSFGYPASYEPVIAVAATNFNDQKAWYSNYGSWVDVSAPGGETMVTNQGVLSTIVDGYAYFQGTSMACPHVAGVAALVFSANPGMSGAQVRAQIEASTDNIDAANPGFAGLLGTGRINAYKALSGGPFPEPPTNLQASVTGNDVQLSWDDPTTNTDGSTINLQHINIYRNGVEIAEVAPGVETFTDTGVPDGSYTYYATATNVEGEESGPSNQVQAIVGDIDVVIWKHPSISDPNLEEKAQERGLTVEQVRELLHEPTSHSALKEALEANGKSVLEITDVTSVDLFQFEALFAVVGIYPNNHVIPANSAEALAIQNYIQGGGKVYMEGGDMWYFDPAFAGGHDFAPLFGLDGISDGSADLSTVLGVNGRFTEGMNFTYSGENNWIDHLIAVGEGYVVHTNQTPVYNCGVARNNMASGANSIGTSYQFGGLNDNSASSYTKNDLMAQYLSHLGISGAVNANFTGNPTSGFAPLTVVFTNTSTGDINTWEWSFPGGSPASATGVGPHTVVYNSTGAFDVSLTVSGTSESDTETKTDYITVEGAPDIAVTPTSFDFTVPPGGSASGVLMISNTGSGTLNWSIDDQEASLMLSNGQTLPVKVKQLATPPAVTPLVSLPAAIAVLEHSLESGVIVPAGPECSDGEIYDDGTAENGYSWNPALVSDGRIVQRFNPGSLPFAYTQVCIAWTRLGADSEIDFNIYVYDDDGAGGAPGTLLASIPVVASGVPVWPAVAFYDFDIDGLVPEINAPFVYIGAQWNPVTNQNFFIGADESASTPLHVGYGANNAEGFVWTPLQNIFPSYRAMFIRAEGGVAADCPWLSANPASGSIPAGGSQQVSVDVSAAGLTPGVYSCNLVINSNDPDEPSVSVDVTLTVEACDTDIEVSPPTLEMTLVPSGSGTTSLTIANIGDCDLNFNIAEAEATAVLRLRKPAQPANRPAAVANDLSSDTPPAGYMPQTVSKNINIVPHSDNVLILKDVHPWGSTANEQILTSLGVPYSIATSADIASLDFTPFNVVIVASDQPQSFYDVFDANFSKFENYVSSGGVLEFHGADIGWVSGFWTKLPGGTTHEQHYTSPNFIADPSHPIVAGLTDADMFGSWASHDHFLTLPANTRIITTDDTGLPTTIEYKLGAGTVIATGMTYEIAFDNPSSFGFWPMVTNTILYSLSASIDIPWLSENPVTGTVSPGSSQEVVVTFDATNLTPGDYYAQLLVSSNDTENPIVAVPVHLTVAIDAVIWIPDDVLEPNLAEKAQQRGLSLQDVEEMSIKPTSHLELQAALEANGKSVIVVNELTSEALSGADYLFAVLGIFPNNHVVKTTDAEAGIIESFIVSGGKVYLEGGDVWYYDPQFLGGYNFGPTFGILSSHDGADDLKTIFGECAAVDKDFTYSGQNNFIDRLEPAGSACTIHTNSTPAYDCGIANDPPSGYRTIGNAFEFSGLNDASLSGSTKQMLMAAYLDFFENGVSIASATFDFPLQNGGWYLISLPVTPANPALNNLFPDAIAAFRWDFAAQNYVAATELAPTKAYWVAMPAATTVEVFGQPVTSYEKTYTSAGWDMLGAVMNSANLQALPTGNVFAMFGYDAAAGNYITARSFEPKNGYWIAVMADENNPLYITVGPAGSSSLTVSASPDFAKSFGAMPPPPPPFTVAANGLTAIPQEYGLLQNYPNPFNPETAIEYHLPEAGEVSLKIYNVLGREVRALVSGEKPAGVHRVIWDGRNETGKKVDSGVYLYRLQVNGFVQTKKVLLIK